MFVLENGMPIIDYLSIIDPGRAPSHSPEEMDKLMKDVIFLRKKYKWKISYGKIN